jgi:Domain of unknown function (DUF4349)
MSMRTRNGNQDPKLERELAAIDATLGGQPVDADLTALAELVVAVRDERPRPKAAFVEELNSRAAAGFPRVLAGAGGTEVDSQAFQPAREPASRRFRLWSGLKARRFPLAFGAAASLLIVVTAVVSSGVLSSSGGPSESRRSDSPVAGESRGTGAGLSAPSSEEQSDHIPRSPAPSAADRAAAPPATLTLPAPAGGGVRPDVRNRQHDRNAAIVLATPRNDVEDTADGVIQVTDRYQGFVLRSNVSGGDRGRAGATLELRIPSDRLQPALRDLSELAHVRSRTQTTQDITARFVSARSRLTEAVAERRALLRQLARATTPNETASIRARLRIANRRIVEARSDLRGLRNRVDFSSVSVAIEADESIKAADGGWTPGDALRDSVDILRTTLGILLVSLAVLLPLAALGLVAWFASTSIRRGYRERALDRGQN